jgi:hypothetical protein
MAPIACGRIVEHELEASAGGRRAPAGLTCLPARLSEEIVMGNGPEIAVRALLAWSTQPGVRLR